MKKQLTILGTIVLVICAIGIAGCTTQIPAPNNQLNTTNVTTTSAVSKAVVTPTPTIVATPTPTVTPIPTPVPTPVPTPITPTVMGISMMPVAVIQGEPIAFTTWVNANGHAVPNLPINCYVNGVFIGTVSSANGYAQFTTGSLNVPLGTVTVTASFAGNSQYGPSSQGGSFKLVVDLNATR